jgi:hypothetical protein
MRKHEVGTREEWSAAHKRLLQREQELGQLDATRFRKDVMPTFPCADMTSTEHRSSSVAVGLDPIDDAVPPICHQEAPAAVDEERQRVLEA